MRQVLITIIILYFSSIALGQVDNLPDTTRSCMVDSLKLVIPENYDAFLWSNGDTTNYTWVYENGYYSVIYSLGDFNYYDTTLVKIFPVSIEQPDTTIFCGDTIILSVDSIQYNYLWDPGELTESSIEVFPREETLYSVEITDPEEPGTWCIDTVRVMTEAKIYIDTLIQLEMGCSGESKGKMDIDVSGEYAPFIYDWSAGYPAPYDSTIVEYIIDGDHEIIISDSLGCQLMHEFTVEPYPMPEIEFLFDPDSVVYIQKPFVTFSFNNLTYELSPVDTFDIITYTWNFGDDETSNVLEPTHTYYQDGEFRVTLDYKTYVGCDGTDSTTVTVKPIYPNIPDIITPNGDSFNEFLVIDDTGTPPEDNENPDSGDAKFGIDADNEKMLQDFYIQTSLIIFNRWGKKVYESENYQNDWNGEGLPDGVYFYVLKCTGFQSTDIFKGTVTILR